MSVCWSVCLSFCLSRQLPPAKRFSRSDRDAVWFEDSGGPRKPCIRWGPDRPMRMRNVLGERTCPGMSDDTLPCAVRKWLKPNPSRCCLGGHKEAHLLSLCFMSFAFHLLRLMPWFHVQLLHATRCNSCMQ